MISLSFALYYCLISCHRVLFSPIWTWYWIDSPHKLRSCPVGHFFDLHFPLKCCGLNFSCHAGWVLWLMCGEALESKTFLHPSFLFQQLFRLPSICHHLAQQTGTRNVNWDQSGWWLGSCYCSSCINWYLKVLVHKFQDLIPFYVTC